MRLFFPGLVYLMFFLSGASALIYEVVLVRSLSLVCGTTHLAVTTLRSVFITKTRHIIAQKCAVGHMS